MEAILSETIKRIHRLLNTAGNSVDMVIVGSVVLKEMELLDREISDIDLYICPEKWDNTKRDLTVLEKAYGIVTSDYGGNSNPFKFRFRGFTVNVWMVHRENWKKFLEENNIWHKDGFKLAGLMPILKAKASYAREKDYKDFLIITRKISNLIG